LRLCYDIFKAAQWPYWLFFLSCVIALCVLFFTRERRIRKDVANQITRQQSLIYLEMHAFQAQMDPHFIFNSLNAIHHYILTTSTDLASLHLTRFARLMRSMIRNCNKEWINLEEDVEALELYLQLEQLRFGAQFDYQLEVLPEVSQQVTMIPPMIIQPYVQEAIWHRILLRPEKTGGQLQIIISRENERLCIRIADNGVPNASLPPAEASFLKGIRIASERLDAINEKYNLHASVEMNEQQVVISMQHVSSRLN
jgi:two-component system, LytTR family, sensor kinase